MRTVFSHALLLFPSFCSCGSRPCLSQSNSAVVYHGQCLFAATAPLTNGRQGSLHRSAVNGGRFGVWKNVLGAAIRSECLFDQVCHDDWRRLSRQDGKGRFAACVLCALRLLGWYSSNRAARLYTMNTHRSKAPRCDCNFGILPDRNAFEA